jgi:hypothetical protein
VQSDEQSAIYSDEQIVVDLVGPEGEELGVAISEPISNNPNSAAFLTAQDPWIQQIRVFPLTLRFGSIDGVAGLVMCVMIMLASVHHCACTPVTAGLLHVDWAMLWGMSLNQ